MDKKWVRPGCLGAWLSDHMSPFRLPSDVLNFIIFQGFLVCVHYMLETVRQPLSASRGPGSEEDLLSDVSLCLQSERRLYTLRDQLKVHFRATQKAQINERKAADSKRRLTSWVTYSDNRRAVDLTRHPRPCRYVFHDKFPSGIS
jgi:hypothetical protein